MDRWANLTVNGYLHRILVWKALWGEIWRTIAKLLPLLKLTEKQGECFTKELYRNLLLEMVFSRNFSRAYCHASKIFHWVDLQEIKVEQTISMTSYCMMHGTSDTLMGEEMRA